MPTPSRHTPGFRRLPSWLPAASVALAYFVGGLPVSAQEEVKPAEFKALKYRSIGPAAGGRVCRVTGVAGNPLVYYAATASGGVWKSGDGGLTWKSLMDSQPLSSAGSIAVAPSNPNVIYLGAGETNLRGNIVVGDGIYKSSDAGKTWTHVWKQEGQIGTMIVHPTNPDIAFAAVLGHAFGPNPERGVYRTTDGGKTWKQVLAKSPDAGASDVCMDPSNPQIVFAGLWQTRRRPWELTSGGPGSGLYMSRDGGATWKQLGPKPKEGATTEGPGKGLPEGPWGKVGVAVAPSDGRRVYALIEADKGGMYRSDDGGETWTAINTERNIRQRSFYYTTITVDPKNPDLLYCPQVSLLKSIDGGRTFRPLRGPHHGDHHDIWLDPLNPGRMINGNDGGVDISTNGGESWYTPPLAISQFYHVAASNHVPYHVSGAMQDLGTASGPSNSLSFGGIARSDWHSVGGGEAGFTAYNTANPDIVYAGEYGGFISRYDSKTHQERNISIYPYSAVGHGGEELRYRFQWTAPLMVSTHDPKELFHAGNILFKTTDEGRHWSPISPDLTRDDKSKEKWSGGPITGDNTGVEIYCTIFAIAESPKQKDLLWTGSDDGLVHVTADGGKNWTKVTIPGLPEWGTVVCIEPSPFDAQSAYVVVDNHRMDDMKPYLFKTTDLGKTWKSLAGALPQNVILHAVREDPKKKGLLYLGTDQGVSFSADDGATWKDLRLNLPTVPVHDLVVKGDDLVLATHGRSLWIFDDLTPIRLWSGQIAGQDAYFFPVAKTIQYETGGGFFGSGGDGANPPRGVVLHYFLKKKPKGAITLEFVDSQGTSVAKLTSKPAAPAAGAGGDFDFLAFFPRTTLPTDAGLHRAVWNMQHSAPTAIPGAQAWPPAPPQGPPVVPGTYTAKLTVDGKTQTQTVVALADPRIHESQAEREEELKFALTVREDITHLAGMVAQIRAIRQQLTAKNELLKDNTKAEPLVKLDKEVIDKLEALESKLHNPKAKILYDLLGQKGGAKLYSQINNIYATAMRNGCAPTQGMREVYAESSSELRRLDAELKNVIANDLVKIQETARKLEIPDIVVPAEKAKEGKK